MGKDKHTFTQLSANEANFFKELAERCENDCASFVQKDGLQKDSFKQCWLKGFLYAEERIEMIFKLSNKEEK